MKSSVCYFVQEGDQLYLCVIDDAASAFHRHHVDTKAVARMVSEGAWIINSVMDGYNPPLLEGRRVAQRVVLNDAKAHAS